MGDIIHAGASEDVFAESKLHHCLLLILKDNMSVVYCFIYVAFGNWIWRGQLTDLAGDTSSSSHAGWPTALF